MKAAKKKLSHLNVHSRQIEYWAEKERLLQQKLLTGMGKGWKKVRGGGEGKTENC